MPELSDRDHDPDHADDRDAPERGGDPDDDVGRTPHRDLPETDDGWVPSGDSDARWKAVYERVAGGRQPRREDVLPYLLIRGFAPGDRGGRPLWPPVPTWESPDILLIDATYAGPFDATRLVGSPTAGRNYRVFVHVWNLGLFPAAGVHVRAWHVSPGFFNGGGDQYRPTLVGGAMVDLEDRTRPACHRIVELDRLWTVPAGTEHECLLASVTCPGDPWAGVLDANADRHVAQRNLAILVGEQDATELLTILGQRVPLNAMLEIVHAGTAGAPVLEAVTGGRLFRRGGADVPVDITPLPLLRHGAAADDGQHLLVMRRDAGRSVFARGDVLAGLVKTRRPYTTPDLPQGFGLRRPGPFPARGTLRHDDTRHMLAELGGARLTGIAATTARPAGPALTEAFAGMLGIDDLRAGTAASALAGGEARQHLLRFIATDADDRLIGGYTIVIA